MASHYSLYPLPASPQKCLILGLWVVSMSVEFSSDSDPVIRVHLHHQICILKLAPTSSLENKIVGASTCTSGLQCSVRIFSAGGQTRQVKLTSTARRIKLPRDVFHRAPSDVLGVVTRLPSVIGRIYSIAMPPLPCKAGSNNDNDSNDDDGKEEKYVGIERTCRILVCASREFLELCAHSLRIVHRGAWPGPTDAVSRVVFLPTGRLRAALALPESAAPAFVAVTAMGAVRCAHGTRFVPRPSASTLASRSSCKSKGAKDVVTNILQKPLACIVGAEYDVVVIIGCLGAIAILFVDKMNCITVHHVNLPNPHNATPSIRPRTSLKILKSLKDAESHIKTVVLIEDAITSKETHIHYDSTLYRIIVRHDDPNLFSMRPTCTVMAEKIKARPKAKSMDVESALRLLLQGISQISDVHAIAVVERGSLHRLLSSYNAALQFAYAWSQHRAVSSSPSTLMSVGHDSAYVRFSIDTVAASSSPCFDSPSPIAGRRAFLTASLSNKTPVVMADGWSLRVRVTRHTLQPLSRHRSNNGSINGTHILQESAIDSSSDGPDKLVVQEFQAALREVNPGAQTLVSFPLAIDSHSPLCVTAVLCFRHPDASTVVQNDDIHVQATLCEDVKLDIFDMSTTCAMSPTAHDASHIWIAGGHIMQRFNPAAVESRRTHTLAHRFQVPIGRSAVLEALSLCNPVSYFESVLNSRFSISVEETPGIAFNAENVGGASTISIHGVAHVALFVRSAVLARLTNDLSHNVNTVEEDPQPKLTLPQVQVHGGDNIERWQRGLLDTADDWHQSLRKAESALVKSLHLVENIEFNTKEMLVFGREIDEQAVVEAISMACSAYDEWRRSTENPWVSEGVKYIYQTQ